MLWVLIRIASMSQAILLSTHNWDFYGELTKITFESLTNRHDICPTFTLQRCPLWKVQNMADSASLFISLCYWSVNTPERLLHWSEPITALVGIKRTWTSGVDTDQAAQGQCLICVHTFKFGDSVWFINLRNNEEDIRIYSEGSWWAKWVKLGFICLWFWNQYIWLLMQAEILQFPGWLKQKI